MDELKQAFFDFIEDPLFPCIGAKAALKKNYIDVFTARSLDSSEEDIDILVKLYQFIELWKKRNNHLQTFALIFESLTGSTEEEFEILLWRRLQHLHELDREIYPWDPQVSSDINNPHFSFSLGSQGFFIVGLHPHSSRKARQFIRPALVFNPHAQFQKLRAVHKFEPMRNKIRERDLGYSGSVNPMLKDFGEASEALQYSGRKVCEQQSCIRISDSSQPWSVINPCSGASFILNKRDLLIVQDVEGEQVADLFCFSLKDSTEFLSSGKSIDYNGKINFSTGDKLYSNKSNPMLQIISDDVKKHDFLFAPCSKETFHLIYGMQEEKNGCYEHLVQALAPYQISSEYIGTTFNIFMNVSLSLKGKARVNPPLSKPGDKIIFQSEMDLLVGLTACSAPQSNNYSFKPIHYKILKNMA